MDVKGHSKTMIVNVVSKTQIVKQIESQRAKVNRCMKGISIYCEIRCQVFCCFFLGFSYFHCSSFEGFAAQAIISCK